MVKDLKDTLNLPKTDFPMRARLVQREPERIAHWRSLDLYGAIQRKSSKNPAYILHDGPPFTNGELHMGHALNKIPKDVATRYLSMRGFRAPYVPGWDCHGLPIEHKVARDLQKEKKELTPAGIRSACALFAENYIGIQREQFERMGVLADWDNAYRTMDPAYEAEILRAFACFVEKGLVYRDKKPVYWSIPCRTALAEAEIEYRDHVSPAIWVKFKAEPDTRLGTDLPVSVVIWTTTPWTLPANLALAVHPRVDYALVRTGPEVFVVAASLAEKFAADCDLESWETLHTLTGEQLLGLNTRHPFIDRASRVVTAEYVTTDSGTGCVHIAPGHGLDDYYTGLQHGLSPYCPVDDDGKFVADADMPADLAGLSVLETDGRSAANDGVLAKLKSTGALLKTKSLQHSYPHCWRSKTPVVFRAMDQWFVALGKDGLRDKALEAISSVEWLPDWGEARIRAAVENRPDWCISRQRSWGVPIPAFYNTTSNAPLLDAGVIRAIADRTEKEGTQFWFEEPAEEILRSIDVPAEWQGQPMKKGADTLDVWIDSGASHLAVLKKHPDLAWPADLYLEGSDQHRGWFQSSLWVAMATEGDAPYKKVLTHGFVVGQDGKKLSKSDGKPQTARSYIDRFGADIIRLWVASVDLRNDAPISDEILGHVGDAYRGLRNTLRFQISNLFDFDPERDRVPHEALDPIDRWALAKTAELLRQTTAAYDAFEFQRVYQLCNQFCTVTLSATYHDILKDRLYTLAPADPLRRSSQTAIHEIFRTLARVLAPVLTFTADEAWSYAYAKEDFLKKPIHLEDWPAAPAEWGDAGIVAEMEALFEIRARVLEQLEGARQKKLIGKSLEAAVTLGLSADSEHRSLVEKYEPFLPELFIVSKVLLVPHPTDALSIDVAHADGSRCPRCWRWVPELIGDPDEQGLCPRCADAINLSPQPHSHCDD